ncbi:LysM peptidoglycan-binding domain-containing protein [Janibacter cremeus]|uniref:LysM repeat protein n=1 Tax=Janibacter cremeus TaxID=1285192 RepID=A0A852VSJ6_9MICO|nr:LysM peptidoglycan-binding domain-containing protein [Janibacter cremeus]NYF96805.1 LysM repeat protein [Janibacter cremeus]
MVLPLFVPVPATPVAPALDLTVAGTETAISAEGSKQHTVRPGETAYDIAQRYGISTNALLSRNNLHAKDFIHPGQKLTVPQRSGSHAAKGRQGKTSSRSGSTRTYTVRSGDTLTGIAARHNMSLDRLRSLNNLGNGFIHPGEKLRVSGAPAKPAKRSTSRPANSTYTVRSGDTLSGIATRQGMSVTKLAKLNGISTSKHIHAGQRLTVTGSPKKSSQEGPAATKKNSFAGRTYSDSIVSAAEKNRATLAGRSMPGRAETKAIITRVARQHGVDPSLALAVSYLESGWNQRQVSVANAVGAMQVIPSSGEWTSSLVGRDLDLLDTQDNATAGVVLLKVLTQQASSNSDAIAGYYQGLASVEANGMYDDTKQYVANVKALRKRM